jgi:hypothetical protein
VEKNDIRHIAKAGIEKLSRAICRTIIHHDDFEIRHTRGAHGLHDLFNGLAFVVTGNYHRNFHGRNNHLPDGLDSKPKSGPTNHLRTTNYISIVASSAITTTARA